MQVDGAIAAVIDFLKELFAFKDYTATSEKLQDLIRCTPWHTAVFCLGECH